MLCLSLSSSSMNQPEVYAWPLPLQPPPYIPPRPSRLSRSLGLSSLCYAELPTSYLFYTRECILFSAAISVDPTLPFPGCVQSLSSMSAFLLEKKREVEIQLDDSSEEEDGSV